MATFRLNISPRLRADGTRNVRIRVTHQRVAKYLSTAHYVESANITKSGKIKDQSVVDAIDETIKEMRRAVNRLGFAANGLTCDELCRYIKKEINQKEFRLPFCEYGEKKIAGKKPSTAGTYRCTFAAIKRYTDGVDPDISEITVSWLRGFVDFLNKEAKAAGRPQNGRATTHYPADIRHIFNLAREEFNDEDIGHVQIRHNPFARFKVGKPKQAAHRNIPREMIQALIDMPRYVNPISEGRGEFDTRNLARDFFLISFCLMGMNGADIYEAKKPKAGVLEYERKKTRDRRQDRAFMKVRIPEQIKPLLKRYKSGPKAPELFRISSHYTSPETFGAALTTGLRRIQKEKGWPRFDFYGARHSWATLAVNECGVDKYTVHAALDHVDKATAVTDIYIARDFKPLWAANEKVLGLFDWSHLE